MRSVYLQVDVRPINTICRGPLRGNLNETKIFFRLGLCGTGKDIISDEKNDITYEASNLKG